MFEIEKGLKEGAEPFIIQGKKIVILNDIHFPFHDEQALTVALEYAEKEGFDTILLNGDIIDNHSISRYNRVKSRVKNYTQEILVTREFLCNLRKYFPSKAIIYKYGNHEDRFDIRLAEKIPEFEGLIGLDELLQFRENGIQLVKSKQIMIAGKLNIIHGHEIKCGGKNVAANMLSKTNENVLFGHIHKKQEHTEKHVFTGSHIAAWSVGCLCDLNPDYMPFNQWVHGFAMVNVEDDGYFQVFNKQIQNGRIM